MKKPSPKPSAPLWIQIATLCLTVALIGFFIFAYIKTPSPTTAQSDLIRFFYPLLAGFAASFISGGLLLFVDFPRSGGTRLALSASAGLAIFIFVYLRPPYWYPGISLTPTPSPGPTVAPAASPSVPVATATRPIVTAATFTPLPPPPAMPAPTPPAPQVSSAFPHSTPLPPPSPVQRAGRVLLLIEEETVLQAMMQKMVDYGLRAMSGREYGEVESRRIREVLPQIQSGNLAASATIPFAVVVMGHVAGDALGERQGAFLVDATATLSATVIPGGETLREKVTQRGGGLRNALREVAANIPEIFYRQIAARAR